MPTERRRGAISFWLLPAVILGSVGFASLAACVAPGAIPAGSPVDSVELPPLPPDVLSLGLTLKPADPSGMITKTEALRAADVSRISSPGINVQAYLVNMTDPSTLTTSVPIMNRNVWLVRYSNFEVTFPGPFTASGSGSVGHVAHFAHVYVDATTGEFILTNWRE